MMTGTFWISTGGATSSVNQRGAEARAAVSVGGIGAYRNAGLVLHRDPHMADRAQLHRQVRQKLLGGKLLMRERRGVADKRLG